MARCCGASAGIPWVHSYGLPNFGGQTSFWMQAFTWTGAVITAAGNSGAVVVFPKSGGTLKYIAASYVSANVPAQPVTFHVSVNQVDQALTVTLPALGSASDVTFADLVIAPSAGNSLVEIHCTAPSNPGSGSTFPSRVIIGGIVNLP